MKTLNKKPASFGSNPKPAKKRKKKEPVALDPQQLIRKAVEPTPEQPTQKEPTLRYSEMAFHPEILANLERLGYVSPTPIQEQSLEPLLEGENLIGIANTGTGKTAAFLLPVIQNLITEKTYNNGVLIVVPTRELAIQIQDEFKALAQGLKLTSNCFIGGTNLNTDLRKARRATNIIIGTPGRLLDLYRQKALSLSKVDTLVLDEFDKMLDMGFVHDVRALLAALKQRKQTMLFSATRDKKLDKLIDEIVQHPVTVEIHSGTKSSDSVEQNIIRVAAGQDKFDVLVELLSDNAFEKVVLFAETKHLADRLGKKLNKSGITADQIHGNKSQNYRIKALEKFKDGKIRVLVATDVAARGIDVPNVTHVINYQVPRDYDTYIHRVGRTGRAGKMGMAYTFVDEESPSTTEKPENTPSGNTEKKEGYKKRPNRHRRRPSASKDKKALLS